MPKQQKYDILIYINYINKLYESGDFVQENKNLKHEQILKKIEKVNGAMSQEGMPLTDELKQKLYNCLIGKSSYDKERSKVLDKYRRIYG